MKYFVKIDRSSIKKNPKAGETTTMVPGVWIHTFEINGTLPDFFEDGKNVIILEQDDGKYYQGELLDPKIIDRCRAEGIAFLNKRNFHFESKRDIQRVYHAPVPRYDFKYEKIKIECENCHSKFNLEQLRSEEFWVGEDEYYSDRICPVCGDPYCCELEFESIDEAVREI